VLLSAAATDCTVLHCARNAYQGRQQQQQPSISDPEFTITLQWLMQPALKREAAAELGGPGLCCQYVMTTDSVTACCVVHVTTAEPSCGSRDSVYACFCWAQPFSASAFTSQMLRCALSLISLAMWRLAAFPALVLERGCDTCTSCA
jgi:hypothetical protein